MSCPNSTESGCRCVQHDPGLAVHAVDADRYEAALERCRRPLRLSMTAGPPTEIACDGTMLCSCKNCLAEKAQRVEKGPLQGDRQQPWHVRPARSRSARAA